MRSIIPVFMGLVNVVISKTEKNDVSSFGYTEARNTYSGSINKNNWRGFRPQSADNDIVPNVPEIKPFVGHRHEIDHEFGINDPQDGELLQTRSIYVDPLNLRKMIARGIIDDNHFDNFEGSNGSIDEWTKNDFNYLSTFLCKLLQQPTWDAPLIIIDYTPFDYNSEETELELSDMAKIRPSVSKRSRYYRPNPYKHKKARFQEEFDAIHLCIPTRDEVYRLLKAVHDVRRGNKMRTVQFCSRQRIARTLITRPRFLGRKK